MPGLSAKLRDAIEARHIYVNTNQCAYCTMAGHESDGSHYCRVCWDALEYDEARSEIVERECSKANARRDARVAEAIQAFDKSGGQKRFFPDHDFIVSTEYGAEMLAGVD